MQAMKTILAIVPNLMHLVKVREAASKCQAVVTEALTDGDAIQKLTDVQPSLIILDLKSRPDNWESIVEKAKKANVPIIAFGPHVDKQARQEAMNAGCIVYANSKFMLELPDLLKKYLFC